MAQKARKDRAKSNATALNNLHIGTATLNFFFLLSHFFRSRSLFAYVLFSIPSVICEFILERTGRPSYLDGNLRSAGEDLSAEGLTEYMFDVVWVTWGCLVVVMLLGDWGWTLWAVIPAYGGLKGYGLLRMARGVMGGSEIQPVEESTATGSRRQRQRRVAT